MCLFFRLLSVMHVCVLPVCSLYFRCECMQEYVCCDCGEHDIDFTNVVFLTPFIAFISDLHGMCVVQALLHLLITARLL